MQTAPGLRPSTSAAARPTMAPNSSMRKRNARPDDRAHPSQEKNANRPAQEDDGEDDLDWDSMKDDIFSWPVLSCCLVFVLIFCAFGLAFLMIYVEYTHFQTIGDFGKDKCFRSKGTPGTEDIQVFNNVAYMSSDKRDEWAPTFWALLSFSSHKSRIQNAETQGGLYSYSMKRLDSPVKKYTLSGYPAADFHPHGLSLAIKKDTTEEPDIFVVNHRRDGSHVEIFRHSQKAKQNLVHTACVESPEFRILNDVAVVDESEFYATNFMSADPGSFMSMFELLTARRWGSVVHCKNAGGWKCNKVVDGLYLANGIAVSLDGREVYVAETMAASVNRYARDATTGSLKLKQKVSTGSTGCDNIDIDRETGELYLACHPSTIAAVMNHLLPWISAPSQVVRMTKCTDALKDEPACIEANEEAHGNTGFVIEDIYSTTGTKWREDKRDGHRHINGGSVAAYSDGHILIGTVFDDGFLRCSVDSRSSNYPTPDSPPRSA